MLEWLKVILGDSYDNAYSDKDGVILGVTGLYK